MTVIIAENDESGSEKQKLTPTQQLHWDRRCLRSMLAQALRMRYRFSPEELELVTNALRQAIERIDVVLGKPKPLIAKKWSDQR